MGPRDALLAEFDHEMTNTRKMLERLPSEKLAWTPHELGGKTMRTLPRAAAFRSLVMSHGIHHRAQLGLYLRLNDVAVPGMYGSSADERSAPARS